MGVAEENPALPELPEQPAATSPNAQAEAFEAGLAHIDIDEAAATIGQEGGIEAHKNRYGSDPSQCPFIGPLGAAGLKLVEKIQAAEKDPQRGKTVSELLAEKRAAKPAETKQPDAKTEPAPRRQSPPQRTESAGPSETRLDQARPLPAQAIHETGLSQPAENTEEPAATFSSGIAQFVEEQRVLAESRRASIDSDPAAPADLPTSQSAEDEPLHSPPAASQPAISQKPAEPAAMAGSPKPAIEEKSLGITPVPLHESRAHAPGSRTEKRAMKPGLTGEESRLPAATRAGRELRPDSEPGVAEMTLSTDPLIRQEREYDGQPTVSPPAERLPVMRLEPFAEHHNELVAAFDTLVSEWLAAERADSETAALPTGEIDESPAEALPAQDADEDNEPSKPALATPVETFDKTGLMAVLEEITEHLHHVLPAAESAASEETAERIEALCSRFFDLLDLPADELAIKTLAQDILKPSLDRKQPEDTTGLSAAELNKRGTHEYKVSLAATLQSHLIRAAQQRAKRFAELSRYILARINPAFAAVPA